MLRIPPEPHIEQSLIVFKPHLGKWILVNFEGTRAEQKVRGISS